MTMNFDLIATIVADIALLVFWLTHLKGGWRGFLLVCNGWAMMFLGYQSRERLIDLGKIVMACVLVALLWWSLTMLVQAMQRRGPRYQPPKEMDGACRPSATSRRR